MRKSLLLAAAVLAAGCHGTHSDAPASAGHRRWLVLAPHPDDEALIASGVIARETADGDEVTVAVMTNGDFDCLNDGLAREAESVAGMAAVGLVEDRIRFLGYPDGGLARLGDRPLLAKRIERGQCVTGTTTYGARGHGHADVHTARTGRPAKYTRDEAVTDLVALLHEIRPHDVVVTHPSDTHPDHAATYALLRSAIDRLQEAPRVHRAIVHNGDCWPTGSGTGEPCPVGSVAVDQPTPSLTGRLRGYEPRERWPVPPSCSVLDPAANAKLRAIAAHASQTRRNPSSYLFSFARKDEAFFPESYAHDGGRWRHAPVRDDGDDDALALLRKDATTLEADDYVLEVDPQALTATLRRRWVRTPIQVWPLAHDLFMTNEEEPFSLEVDPRSDEGVVEITLRVRGEVIGVAIDVSR